MIHPTALIDPKAELADDVEVGAFSIIMKYNCFHIKPHPKNLINKILIYQPYFEMICNQIFYIFYLPRMTEDTGNVIQWFINTQEKHGAAKFMGFQS